MNNSRRQFIKRNTVTMLGTAVLSGASTSVLGNAFEFLSQDKKDILFFDAFTRIGPRKYKHPAEKWLLEDLVKALNYCSVSGAMVSSTLSVSYDAMYSNLELTKALKSHSNLFPIWNVLPHHTNEFLDRYKSIPLLVSGISWGEQRYAIPLLIGHPNFHISFDRFQINQGLEFLYKKGHIDQLIYATDAPTMSVGAHRTYIDYADIPEDAKAKIAGGNLIRLLKGLRPPVIHTNKEEDVLMTAVRNGRPLPVPVIDMHMHMLHEGLNGAGGTGYHMENGGPKGIFSMMERLGVVGGGFMSWNGVVSNDSVQGNKLVKEALDVSPKGYWGLVTFSPTHYTQEELSVMIPEVYADKRIIGMKPYHFYGMEYHNPAYDIWWEYGNKNGLYALIHASRSDLLEVDKLAEKYQNVRWVIAHAGGSYQMADMAIAVMKKHKNVFAEITLTPVPLGVIEYMVAALGDDRLLYGSDLPMRDPRQQLGWVVFANLPLESKKKILGQNAYKVVEPCLKNMPEHNIPASFRK